MEELIVNSGVMTAQCYRVFFDQLNFFDMTCLKPLVSKALGYMVIAGSVGVKIPQILSIVRAGSVAGISLSMFVLELIGLTINLGYNYLRGNPFSTWGETFFLLVQTVIIVALILHYSKAMGIRSLAAMGVWVAALGAIVTGQISAAQMAFIQPASIAIFVMSKVPQVIINFKNRSTGKLAFLTFFLNTAGGAARIFTTIQELADLLLLTSALLGFTLNLIITLQILIFGDKSTNSHENSKNTASNASIDTTGRSGIIELSRHRLASDAADHKSNIPIESPLPNPPSNPHLDLQVSPSTSPSLGTDDSEEVHPMNTDSSEVSMNDSEEVTTDETNSMPSSSPRIRTGSFSTSEDTALTQISSSSQKKLAKLLGEDPGSSSLSTSEDSNSGATKKDKKDKKNKKAEKEKKEKEKKEKKDRRKAEKEEEKRKKKGKEN